MFALRELLETVFMALRTGLGRDCLQLVNIVCRLVTTPVTVAATDLLGVMPADLPVIDDVARFLAVTVDTIVGDDDRANKRKN